MARPSWARVLLIIVGFWSVLSFHPLPVFALELCPMKRLRCVRYWRTFLSWFSFLLPNCRRVTGHLIHPFISVLMRARTMKLTLGSIFRFPLDRGGSNAVCFSLSQKHSIFVFFLVDVQSFLVDTSWDALRFLDAFHSNLNLGHLNGYILVAFVRLLVPLQSRYPYIHKNLLHN